MTGQDPGGLQVPIDALPIPAAVVDTLGRVLAVNAAWPGGVAVGSVIPIETELRPVFEGRSRTAALDYEVDEAEGTRWFRVVATATDDEHILVTHTPFATTDSHDPRIDLAPVSILELDTSGRLTWADAEWLTLTGRSMAEERGQGWLAAIHEHDRHAFAARLQQAMTERKAVESQVRVRDAEGMVRWLLFRWRPRLLAGQHFAGLVGSGTDITDERSVRAELAHRATTDPLTGLPNRLLFVEHLKHELAVSERWPDRNLAVLFCDLDRFAAINERHGHLRADELLASVAARLRRSVRPFDVVSRFGGDEFLVLLRSLHDAEVAYAAAERLLSEVGRPYRMGDQTVEITASVGLASPGSPDEAPESLIRRADEAMYRAKRLGRGRIEVAGPDRPTIDLTAADRTLDIEGGLLENEFRPWYQPIVDIEANQLVACEALLRWIHPSFGALAAGEFIELATSEGLLVPLANRAIEHAIHDMAASAQEIDLFVNLSPHQLEGDIANQLLTVCEAAGFDQTRLVVEITESVLVTDTVEAQTQLGRLADTGVRLAIDDFGSGYSAFSRLKLFPVSILKIDSALVTDIDADEQSRALVEGVVNLAHGLEVQVVAEGVESEAELAVLRELGVSFAQGYHFGAAVPLASLTNPLDLLRPATPTLDV